MRFLLLVYIDEARVAALPEGEFDRLMRGCFESADALRREGVLIDAQQLEPVQTARAVRRREGRLQVTDGPFAETKELLAGFNLIEAPDLASATRIAEAMPWTALGCIEVRPVRDMESVRARVGA